MKKEDLYFLENLKEKMTTKNNMCQADPCFWVVVQTTKYYGIEKGHEDGFKIIYNCKNIGNSLKDLYKVFKEYDKNFKIKLCKQNRIGFSDNLNNKIGTFVNVDEMVNYLRNECGCDIYISRYKNKTEIVQNTMFLTLEECKKHIEQNYYHYNEPRPYAMTAWRSPEVQRLYEIIRNTDWEKERKLSM